MRVREAAPFRREFSMGGTRANTAGSGRGRYAAVGTDGTEQRAHPARSFTAPGH